MHQISLKIFCFESGDFRELIRKQCGRVRAKGVTAYLVSLKDNVMTLKFVSIVGVQIVIEVRKG